MYERLHSEICVWKGSEIHLYLGVLFCHFIASLWDNCIICLRLAFFLLLSLFVTWLWQWELCNLWHKSCSAGCCCKCANRQHCLQVNCKFERKISLIWYSCLSLNNLTTSKLVGCVSYDNKQKKLNFSWYQKKKFEHFGNALAY